MSDKLSDLRSTRPVCGECRRASRLWNLSPPSSPWLGAAPVATECLADSRIGPGPGAVSALTDKFDGDLLSQLASGMLRPDQRVAVVDARVSRSTSTTSVGTGQRAKARVAMAGLVADDTGRPRTQGRAIARQGAVLATVSRSEDGFTAGASDWQYGSRAPRGATWNGAVLPRSRLAQSRHEDAASVAALLTGDYLATATGACGRAVDALAAGPDIETGAASAAGSSLAITPRDVATGFRAVAVGGRVSRATPVERFRAVLTDLWRMLRPSAGHGAKTAWCRTATAALVANRLAAARSLTKNYGPRCRDRHRPILDYCVENISWGMRRATNTRAT